MEEASNHPACASCKHQRKKCTISCVFARHFPSSRMEEFIAVHKVFGVANVTKMIKDLDLPEQDEAVASLKWEASMWEKNPVDGPYGQYKRLEEKIRTLIKEQGNVQPVMPLIMDQTEVGLVPFVGENNVNNCDEDTIKNYIHGNGALELDQQSTLQGNYIEEEIDAGISSQVRETNGRDGLNMASYNSFVQERSDGNMYNSYYGQERSGSCGRDFGAVNYQSNYNGQGQRRISQEREAIPSPFAKRRDIGNYAVFDPPLLQRQGWVLNQKPDDDISLLYQQCLLNNHLQNTHNPDQ